MLHEEERKIFAKIYFEASICHNSDFFIYLEFKGYSAVPDWTVWYRSWFVGHKSATGSTDSTQTHPAISINENQSLIAINIINNNPLIIIDWFNQSIKIDTHSPNGLNCYWLLLIFILLIFLLIIILLSSLSVAQVNVPGVCFFAILRRHTNYLF